MGIEGVQNQAQQPVKTPAHQHVYEQLRALILYGDLAPGAAVTIQGLTEMLGAGMTPVREALRRLVAQDALTLHGNRRVSVPVLTQAHADELAFLRKTLEPELARRTTGFITPDLLMRLRAQDEALNQTIAAGDVGGYLRRNHTFHHLIYSAAQAPIMAATADRLWLRFGPSLRVVCGQAGTKNLPDKHADLLAAFEAGDAPRAARAMAQDVAQGMRQIAKVAVG